MGVFVSKPWIDPSNSFLVSFLACLAFLRAAFLGASLPCSSSVPTRPRRPKHLPYHAFSYILLPVPIRDLRYPHSKTFHLNGCNVGFNLNIIYYWFWGEVIVGHCSTSTIVRPRFHLSHHVIFVFQYLWQKRFQQFFS